ncbi:MAG TPA: hypothetical protein VMV41_00935 [Cellulomonadaceae bacterium]|nr:hypothetical protein [Cellulomonadaceae bacterium]
MRGHQDVDGPPPHASHLSPAMRGVVGAALGAGVGLAVGGAIYLSVSPILERSTGIVREAQGLLWNLVPLLTVVGALAGWLLLRRHRH